MTTESIIYTRKLINETTERNFAVSILRASLRKILISSFAPGFAHTMDFAHNFSVDFF